MIPNAITLGGYWGATPISQESEWPVEGPSGMPAVWGAPCTLTEPHEHVQSFQRTPATPVVVVNTASEAELQTMRAQIEELSREVKELRSRVMAESIESQPLSIEVEQVKPSWHRQWVRDNLDQLRQYPGEYVALDPEKGIVAHAADQKDFGAQLRTLSELENKRLVIIHSSSYLHP